MTSFDPPIANVQQAFPNLTGVVRLGAGGQKIVYTAAHPQHAKVALKIVRPHSARETERTLREVQAAQRLSGPHFAKVHETAVCKVAGEDCIVIYEEFIDGEPLRDCIGRGPVPLLRVRDVSQLLLQALEQVEKAKLVHRDIKPENVILETSGRVILIDFGIARHLDQKSITSTYDFLGPMTLGYCSPEQITNQKRSISIRTDFFALGVVMYEMCTGENPFLKGASSAQDVLQRCLKVEPQSLSQRGFSASLSDFVQMCMSKAANRRPATVAQATRLFQTIDWR